MDNFDNIYSKIPVPSKILLPRFDTFGDLVLMEGFIEQLQILYPMAEISILVRSAYEQILHLFPKSLSLSWILAEGDPYRSGSVKEREIYDQFLNRIYAESWDLVIFTAFNRNWMDDALAKKFKDVFKVALGTCSTINGWLTTKLAVISVVEKSHETVKYQAILSALKGVGVPLPQPRLEVGVEFQSKAVDVLNEFGLTNTQFVACCPAGTQNQISKVWPLERYAELLSWLYSDMNYKLLLLGHESEEDIIRSLVSMLISRSITVQVWLGSDGSIPILAGLFQKANLYVGNDTGPMHIAAAVGIPVVGMFGGGTFPRFLPSGERAIGVAGELPCFGCYWNCWLGDAPCMRVVSVDDAKRAVLLVLAAQPPESNYLPVIDGGVDRLAEFMQKCCDFGRKEAETFAASREYISVTPELTNSALHECQNRLRALQSSFSWRITTPLRWISDWIKK